MVRIIKYAPKHRPNDTDGDPLFDEKRPLYSVAAEDEFDDLLAGLIHRPDAAPPDAAPPDAAPPDAAPSDATPNEPARVRLPSVEEFRFEETTARSMASKLAPILKPRIKRRRPRYRSPNRDRWRFPDDADEQNVERDTDSRDLPQAIAAPGRSGRGLFWSFCASILIVMGTSAAFGFVQPLNDLLPKRMGAFLSNVSDGLSTGLFKRADPPADIEVAGDNAASSPPPVIPDPHMASAAVARSVSTTSIAAEVRPSARSGGFGIVEQSGTTGVTGEEAFGSGVAALELAPIYGAAAELATFDSAAAPAAPDEGKEYHPPMPALLQSLKADPPPLMTTPAITHEPVSSAAQSTMSSLPAAQIDGLLARGQELLQCGEIASARLLFQRVAAAGDWRGARGVGMTYDPNIYARLPVTGLTPDREQAKIWYKKAGVNPTFQTARNTIADTPNSQEPGSPEWNAACALKYSSFEPNTGLYTAHSGVKRPCRLP